MPNLNLRQFTQDQLFDPGPRSDRLSVRQFMDRASWHGTNRKDWATDAKAEGISVHSGTAQAAADRRDPDPVISQWTGEVLEPSYYPIVPNEVADKVVQDDEANRAEDDLRGNFSYSRVGGNDPAASGALWALRQGKTVPYTNRAEDAGSTSYVSPPGGFQTLADTTNFADLPRGTEHITGTDLRQQGVRRKGNRLHARSQPELPYPVELRWNGRLGV